MLNNKDQNNNFFKLFSNSIFAFYYVFKFAFARFDKSTCLLTIFLVTCKEMRSLKTFAQYKLIYICIFWLEYVSHVNKPTVRRKCVPGFKLEIFSQINSGDKVGRVKLGLCLKRSLLRCSTQQETVHFDAFLTLKILPLVWVRELLGRSRRQDG